MGEEQDHCADPPPRYTNPAKTEAEFEQENVFLHIHRHMYTCINIRFTSVVITDASLLLGRGNNVGKDNLCGADKKGRSKAEGTADTEKNDMTNQPYHKHKVTKVL